MAWVDFKETKGLVTMRMFLDHYGVIVPFGSRPQLYSLPCPFPTHSAQNKKSLNVNLAAFVPGNKIREFRQLRFVKEASRVGF